MSIKGLLFDFDGTLCMNSDIHTMALIRTFAKYGVPAPSDEKMTLEIFGKSNELLYRENIDANGTREDILKFHEIKENEYHDQFLELPHRFRLTDGAYELLDYLKDNGIPFCMATGSPIANIDFYREHLGIDKWFGDGNLIYDDGTFKGKPAPDVYLKAAERIGLDPSECLVFEDGTSGIKAARAAGCGGVVAVYDKRFELPGNIKAMVDSIHHDLNDWKNILSNYGI